MISLIQSEVKRMIPKLWLRLLMFLAICAAFVAVTPPLLATVPYDRQCPVSVPYDGQAKHAAYGFDGAEVQSINESCREGAASNALLAAFSKFLAAEGGAKDLTYLYQKVGAEGEHLKFGITKNPATRYTQEELAGGRLKIIGQGSREDMLQLERNLHETLPIGPEEAQKFYIQKQIEKGLKPPPYNP